MNAAIKAVLYVVAQHMSVSLGQSIFVENRAGAKAPRYRPS